MSAQPARLHLVDPETGEVTEAACPHCAEKDHVIAGLQSNVAGWAIKYGELRADKEREARESPLWPVGYEHFKLWRRLCNHPNSDWTADRFYMARPYLKSKKYAPRIPRAIAGLAFDPFVTTRKNGTKKRHDGWHLLFKSADAFEENVNRAPTNWEELIS